MSIFRKATIEQAFLKAGVYGMAGAGKTVTSCLLLIGTILECRKRGIEYASKPAFFVDTEGGSDFVVPMFDHFGIELVVAKTRAFVDMEPAMLEASKDGSGILIDSVTHPWREFMESYKRKKKRSFIQFEDWDYLKTRWGQFTSLFTQSPVHAILAGRAGYEYEHTTNEETGKKEIEKVGTRMKTEGEMAFEPSLLIEVELEQNLQTKESWNVAYVRKDRWQVIQGGVFNFNSKPGERYDEKLERVWAAFSPHVMRLNLGGAHRALDADRKSDDSIPAGAKPEYKRRAEEKEILLEKTSNLFNKHGLSGQSKEGKAAITKHLQTCFGTDSWKQIEYHWSYDQVRDGFNKLHIALEGGPYFVDAPPPAELEERLPAEAPTA